MIGWLQDTFGTTDEAGFARGVVRALRRAGCDANITFDARSSELRIGGGTLFLGRIHAEFLELPRTARRGHLDHIAALLLESLVASPEPVDLETARAQLIPRVRERIYWELNERMFESTGNGATIPMRPVGSHHVIELCLDLPASYVSVNAELLATWGVSFEDALQIAEANFRAIEPPALSAIDGKTFATVGDATSATYLLFPELLPGVVVTGDLVALTLDRETLILANADDPESLQIAAELAWQFKDRPRFMTAHALRRVDGEWEDYLPPPDHPERAAFERLAAFSDVQAAASDLASLENDDRSAPDVAHLVTPARIGMKSETETVAIWLRGPSALLPRADWIACGIDTSTGDELTMTLLGVFRWEDVIAEWRESGRAENRDGYVARVLVRGFPEDEILARWRASILHPESP